MNMIDTDFEREMLFESQIKDSLYSEYGKKIYRLNLLYSEVEKLRMEIALLEEQLNQEHEN